MIELGLIGYPLGHSRSPEYFDAKFRELGIEGRYDLFPLERIENLPELIESHPGLRGFNVTIPYKQTVMDYLTYIRPEAKALGAVNTVRVDHVGDNVILTGYNTDCRGFSDSISPIINRSNMPADTAALILGTGGAAKAVAYALGQLAIPFMVVSRNHARLESFPASDHTVIGYEDLTPEVMKRHRILVNCTPLGMWPNVDGCPAVPWELLPDNAICYDLVYNPPVTEFMRQAAARGATVKNGLEMLHRQADAAWDIWQK